VTLLEIEGVSKSFDVPRGGRNEAVFALHDVNLSVEESEFCVIIGPSGCGKSTLLRLVGGLSQPTSGQMHLGGQAIDGPGGDRAMVFQQANLFPWRTALANVAFSLECSGVRKRAAVEQARSYLDLVGLTPYANYYPSQMSGGMQQRVGIARALAVEPEILLLDEPFGALDAQTRLLMQDELERIWLEHRRTTLLVTHDIEEAVYLADRVICISPGPGHVAKIIDVPFERPRSAGVRLLPEFAALKAELWDWLMSTKAGLR
jgi:NitT/TauT family transport system ATP-binding protein